MYKDTADVPEKLGSVDAFHVIVDAYNEGCGVTVENHTGTGNGYFSHATSLDPDEAEELGNLLIKAAKLYRKKVDSIDWRG